MSTDDALFEGGRDLRKPDAQTGEQIYRDALDHIARVAINGRTVTNRLEWIKRRARQALAGIEYDPRADLFRKTRTNRAELEKHLTEANDKLRRVGELKVICDRNVNEHGIGDKCDACCAYQNVSKKIDAILKETPDE